MRQLPGNFRVAGAAISDLRTLNSRSRTIRHVAFNVRATLQVEGQEQCAVFWLPRVEKNLTRVQMCSIHRLFAVGERLPE